MRRQVLKCALSCTLLAGGTWLATAPAHGQHPWFGGRRVPECPPAPCPPAEGVPEPTPRPEPAPVVPPPALTAERAGALAGESVALMMIGDQLGIPPLGFGPPGNPRFPPVPGQAPGIVLIPSIRGFKISEDESPRPQDRAYFGFNYFDRVNEAVNRRFFSDIHNIRVYRETFGLEKTFLGGDASVGLRLPLNTLSADSNIPGLGGTSTDIGDLSVILKAALLTDSQSGNVLSAGLAVTAPTGPDSFAGFQHLTNFHNTTLQPFVGYIRNWGDFFLHGFLSIDVPTDSNDVTQVQNDIGLGYYLLRDRAGDRVLSAVVPTFEVHVNTPLNHRGALHFADPAGTPDVVDLTTGTTFVLCRRATLAAAFVTPVTGPKPFDFEFITQLNLRFGARGAAVAY